MAVKSIPVNQQGRVIPRKSHNVGNRSIWDKGNSYTPESTTRRCHNAWEPVLWLVKDASEYFFAPDQVRVPYDTDFVIDKRQPRHFQVDGGRGRKFEYWSKGGMSLRHPKGKIPSDIVRVSRAAAPHKIGEEVRHSAPYPPALVRELLKGVVEEDYLVLDPFCGQATTGIVAAELNCRFIGYDISQSFCRLSRRRLMQAYSVLR